MPLRSSPARDALIAVAGIGSLIYPFAVYFGLTWIGAHGLVAIALLLGALRLCALRNPAQRRLGGWALLAASVILAATLAVEADLAAKLYPVLVSLGLAGLFGASLIWPPTLIERIARRRTPDLNQRAIAYTRGVTRLWTVFLLANAGTAAALARWGSLELWTLWTGALSYLLIGLLLIGEWGFRRHFLAHRATAHPT